MGLKIKIKKPKITWDAKKPLNIGSGNNEWNKSIGQVDKWGDEVENGIQKGWNDVTGKTARTAAEKAAKEAEKARREAIVRQFGEKMQADSMGVAGLMRNNNGSGGGVGAGNAGFIGSGGSLSGTF